MPEVTDKLKAAVEKLIAEKGTTPPSHEAELEQRITNLEDELKSLTTEVESITSQIESVISTSGSSTSMSATGTTEETHVPS